MCLAMIDAEMSRIAGRGAARNVNLPSLRRIGLAIQTYEQPSETAGFTDRSIA